MISSTSIVQKYIRRCSSFGNTLEIIFELIETKNNTKTDVKSQKRLKETNMDILFNIIGSF